MSDDNEHAPEEDLRSPREKASKIPSWIMVGFLLGCLCFYTINDYLVNRKKTPPSATPATGSATPPTDPIATASGTTQQQQPDDSTAATAPAPAKLTLDTATKESSLLDNSRQMTLFAMDAIFRQWQINAMWDYNTTQVIFWNPKDGKYSVAVEIFRIGTDDTGYEYYYRRMDRPTRPVVKDETRPDAPILFTENEEATQRRKEKPSNFWLR